MTTTTTTTDFRHPPLLASPAQLIHASSSTSLSVFFAPWFSFSFTLGPFCNFFFPPILSATFKRFIYDTFIHTTRPYRIDGGELARYTTPYLNFYGLVSPPPFAPPFTFSSHSMDEQTTHHSSSSSNIHRRFFYIFFFSLGQRRTHCFFLSLHLSSSPSYLFFPSVVSFWTVGSPRNLYQDNFGIMSFHVIHPHTPCLSSTAFATPR